MTDSTSEDLASEQPNTAGDSLIAVLDELMETVRLARGVPMSASAVVNRSEMLDLLGTARDIVPDQIHAADEVLAEAAEVRAEAQRRAKATLEAAHADAEETVRSARAKAAELVSDHEITEAARVKAANIEAEARQNAENLERGANRYTDDSLAGLQATVEKLMGQIHAGREEIARRTSAHDSRPDGADERAAAPQEGDGLAPWQAAEQQPSHVGFEEAPEPALEEEDFEPPFEVDRD